MMPAQAWVVVLSSAQQKAWQEPPQLNLAVSPPVLCHPQLLLGGGAARTYFLCRHRAQCLTSNISCHPHNSQCDRCPHCTGLDCPSQPPPSHSHPAPVVFFSFTWLFPKSVSVLLPRVSSAPPFTVSFSCLLLWSSQDPQTH